MLYIIFFIASFFSLTQPVFAQGWVDPVGNPPANNAAEPVNISSNSQVKAGGFGAASLSSVNSVSVGGNIMIGSADAPSDPISILTSGTYGNSYGKWSAFGRVFSGLPLYLSSGDYGYGTVWDSGGVFLGLNNRGSGQKDAVLGWGSNATYPTDLIYKYNGAEVARMTNVGRLGLGTTTPAYPLDVNGTAKSTNVLSNTGTFGSIAAASFTYSSDRNLKKNITPLESSLAKVLKLDGVSFNWKTDTDKAEKKIGFIAQDVEKVFPEVVSGDKVKGVEYANLVAPLVEAVKEQQVQIESQKKEIESLKNEKQILERRLMKIEQVLGL